MNVNNCVIWGEVWAGEEQTKIMTTIKNLHGLIFCSDTELHRTDKAML